MTLHAFAEYLKYKWAAKGRHGIHSPFVYGLVEHVLLDKGALDKTYIVSYRSMPLKYENLVSRIAAYFRYRDVLFLPQENEDAPLLRADMLMLKEGKTQEWVSELNKHFHLLKDTSAVTVVGIHQTALHTKAWRQMCADPRIRMSIDIYGIGLLLFREEFKIKQHFVLKYD